MNYKGAYDGNTSYSKGDAVIYDVDGVAYAAIEDAGAGITPHEERCWARIMQPMQDVVQLIFSALGTLSIPDNINDEAITLKTDDGEYLITVDDTGDDPELAVTAIEEEA
jgi:hypothetical protein